MVAIHHKLGLHLTHHHHLVVRARRDRAMLRGMQLAASSPHRAVGSRASYLLNKCYISLCPDELVRIWRTDSDAGAAVDEHARKASPSHTGVFSGAHVTRGRQGRARAGQ